MDRNITAKEYAGVDLRDQVPDLASFLRPNERVVSVQNVPSAIPDHLLDRHKAICLLTGVNDPKDVGLNGPASAAKALPGNERDLGQGLFDTWFGRDGLYAAEDLMAEFPLLARTTILNYASLLGMAEKNGSEEEFGRIFHEARDYDPSEGVRSPKAAGNIYLYATTDATPLFIKVLAKYCRSILDAREFLEIRYKGADGQEHTMFEALQFAARWVVRKMNCNPEGFVEYRSLFREEGLVNECMEDSYDSHFHKDGSLADFDQGIASTEIQGLAHDALLYASELYSLYGKSDRFLSVEAEYFEALAERLERMIMTRLWVEEDGLNYFSPGTDRDEKGNIRVMKIKKAIPAFLFDSMLFDNGKENEKVRAYIKTIFGKTMLAAGGIRSLAWGEPRFMPGGYHTGNVWLFQNFKIAEGLRRMNYRCLAAEIDKRIVKAVEQTRMYPEFVSGNADPDIKLNERIIDTWDDDDKRMNRREQPPQQIQLWTVSAYSAIKYRQEKDGRVELNVSPDPFEEKILGELPN